MIHPEGGRDEHDFTWGEKTEKLLLSQGKINQVVSLKKN